MRWKRLRFAGGDVGLGPYHVSMRTRSRPPLIHGDGSQGQEAAPWRLWAALVVLYFVWGSTYLAIKVAIDSIPPLLMAAIRFVLAGGLLLAWAAPRGDRIADPLGLRQWIAAAVVGGALLLGGNGGVVLAEGRGVPTGIVALIVATVPLWMAMMDRIVTRTKLPTVAVIGLVIGFAGLALLVGRSDGDVDLVGVGYVMMASFLWAAGSVYARRSPLPKRAFVASGMELLCGGVLLGVAGTAAGELSKVHPDRITLDSLLALGYLILVGSIVAYSAYVWLLGHAPLRLAGTYAYVNPVVAVFLGWLILSEPITPRTLFASAIILIGVALIVTARPSVEPVAPPSDAAPVDLTPPVRTGRESA
jgi:drug/metabolite transporter (DMT)-like permease